MARPDRRATILDLTTELLLEQGCAATTIHQIAERIGITEPGVYYWVGSKEQLIIDIVTPFLDAVDELLGDEASDATSLDTLHGYAELLDRHRDIARLVDQDLIELRRIEHLAERIDAQTASLRKRIAAGGSAEQQSMASAMIGAIRRPVTVLDGPLPPKRRRDLVTAVHAALGA